MHYRFTTTFAAALIALPVFACDERSESPPVTEHSTTAAPPAATDMHEHARPGVEPRSHEDWCEEHQVPESLCTRCNPSLIVAFKATGDWCEEHGLPESQCLICNPDLKIERPPRPAEASP